MSILPHFIDSLVIYANLALKEVFHRLLKALSFCLLVSSASVEKDKAIIFHF